MSEHRVSVTRCKPPIPIKGMALDGGYQGFVYRGSSGFPLHTTVACGTYEQAEGLAEDWVKAQGDGGASECRSSEKDDTHE